MENFTWSSNQWVYSIGNLDLVQNAGKLKINYYGSIVTFQFTVTCINDQNLSSKIFNLEQNYPNPFNPSTSIQYTIRNSQFVSLKVYDVLGNEVATIVNEEKPIGSYVVNFNANGLASGVYFYRLQAGSFNQTKKFILMR